MIFTKAIIKFNNNLKYYLNADQKPSDFDTTIISVDDDEVFRYIADIQTEVGADDDDEFNVCYDLTIIEGLTVREAYEDEASVEEFIIADIKKEYNNNLDEIIKMLLR